MLIFYVTEDVDIGVDYRRQGKALLPALRVIGGASREGSRVPAIDGTARGRELRFRRAAVGALSADTLYVGGASEVRELARALSASGRPQAADIRLLTAAACERIWRRPGMPVRIGYVRGRGQPFVPLEEQVARFDRSRPLRIAMVNEYSAAFGDSLSCLTLLRELERRLRPLFPSVHIDLLQTRFSRETDVLYSRSNLVSGIRMLPVPLSALAAYDAYIELDFAAAPPRRTVPWIDSCLEAIGIAPAEVAPERKRVRLTLDSTVAPALSAEVQSARAAGRPLLLFHPLASTQIRSLPETVAEALLSTLIAQIDCTAVCAVPVAFSRERLLDWSGLSSAFDHFAYLVSQVDMFVSVDTVTYHLADAFDVPGVVLFTSIDPAARIPYYPYVAGVRVWPEDRLSGLSFSDRPEDVRHANSLWDRLDVDAVVTTLRDVVRRRAAAGARRTA